MLKRPKIDYYLQKSFKQTEKLLDFTFLTAILTYIHDTYEYITILRIDNIEKINDDMLYSLKKMRNMIFEMNNMKKDSKVRTFI